MKRKEAVTLNKERFYSVLSFIQPKTFSIDHSVESEHSEPDIQAVLVIGTSSLCIQAVQKPDIQVAWYTNSGIQAVLVIS